MTDRPPAIARDLLAAADWFDERLRERLVERGWPPLSRNQALVFAHLEDGGSRSARLAERLGITRQSVSTLVGELVDEGILELAPDPHDRRARLVRPTRRGQRLLADALTILAALEDDVAEVVGRDALDSLRTTLAHRWWEDPHP